SPVLSSDDDTRSRLSRAGILLAERRWAQLPQTAQPRMCGTLEVALDEADAISKRNAVCKLQLPEEWVQWMDETQALSVAGLSGGYGGLFFPRGKQVRPGQLVRALLSSAEQRA